LITSGTDFSLCSSGAVFESFFAACWWWRGSRQKIENAADWSEAKKYGVDKLNGGARLEAKKLLEMCKEVGPFLVPKGELECWWRDGPATKREWVTAALSKFGAEPNELKDAREFVADVCSISVAAEIDRTVIKPRFKESRVLGS